MDAITLITNDTRRRSETSKWLGWMGALFGVSIIIILGIGLREDWVGVFAPENLISNLLMTAMVGLYPVFYFQPKEAGQLTHKPLPLIAALVLFLSLRKVFFYEPLTIYANMAEFWEEIVKCLVKGTLTSALLSAASTLILFRLSALPTLTARSAALISSSLGGVVMLAFHCDSTSIGHTVLAHWGQGLLVITVAYAVQRVLILRTVNTVLAGRDKNLTKFKIP